MSAEQAARQTIDKLLAQAGWAVQDFKQADIHAARGVAIREFVLNEGHGFADYLLYVDGKAARNHVVDAPTTFLVRVRSFRNARCREQRLTSRSPSVRRTPRPSVTTGLANMAQ